MHRVSQKSNRRRLLHTSPLVAILRRQTFTQLFAIHILTYVLIFVRIATLFVTLTPNFNSSFFKF